MQELLNSLKSGRREDLEKLLAKVRDLESQIRDLNARIADKDREIARLNDLLSRPQPPIILPAGPSAPTTYPSSDDSALRARIKELEYELAQIRERLAMFMNSLTPKERALLEDCLGWWLKGQAPTPLKADGELGKTLERLRLENGRLAEELQALRKLLQTESELGSQAERLFKARLEELSAQRELEQDNAKWWKRVAELRKDAVRKLEVHLSYAQQEATVERSRVDKMLALAHSGALMDQAAIVQDDASDSGLTDVSELAAGHNAIDLLVMDGKFDKKALTVLSQRAGAAVEVGSLQSLLSIDFIDFGAVITQVAVGLVPQYRTAVAFPISNLDTFTLGQIASEKAVVSLICVVNNQHVTLAQGKLSLGRLLAVDDRHQTRTIAARLGLFPADGFGEQIQDADEPIMWVDIKAKFRYSILDEVMIAEQEDPNVKAIVRRQEMMVDTAYGPMSPVHAGGMQTMRQTMVSMPPQQDGGFTPQGYHSAAIPNRFGQTSRPASPVRSPFHTQHAPVTTDGMPADPRVEFQEARGSLWNAKMRQTNRSLMNQTSVGNIPDEADIDSRLLSGAFKLQFSILQAKDLNLCLGLPSASAPAALKLKPYVSFSLLGSESATPQMTKTGQGANPVFDQSWTFTVPVQSAAFREWACNGGLKLLCFTDDDTNTDIDLATGRGADAIKTATQYMQTHLGLGKIGTLAPNGVLGFATVSLHNIFLDAGQELLHAFPLRESADGKATGGAILVHAKWVRGNTGAGGIGEGTQGEAYSGPHTFIRDGRGGGHVEVARRAEMAGGTRLVAPDATLKFASEVEGPDGKLPPLAEKAAQMLQARFAYALRNSYLANPQAGVLEHVFFLFASRAYGGDAAGYNTGRAGTQTQALRAALVTGGLKSNRSLSVEDFAALAKSVPGLALLRREVAAVFSQIEASGNDSLSFEELSNAVQTGLQMGEELRSFSEKRWTEARQRFLQAKATRRQGSDQYSALDFVMETTGAGGSPDFARKLVLSETEFRRFAIDGLALNENDAAALWCTIDGKIPDSLTSPGGLLLCDLAARLDPDLAAIAQQSSSQEQLDPSAAARSAANRCKRARSGLFNLCARLQQGFPNIRAAMDAMFPSGAQQVLSFGQFSDALIRVNFAAPKQLVGEMFALVAAGRRGVDQKSLKDAMQTALVAGAQDASQFDDSQDTAALRKEAFETGASKDILAQFRQVRVAELVAFKVFTAVKRAGQALRVVVGNLRDVNINSPLPACKQTAMAQFVQNLAADTPRSAVVALVDRLDKTPEGDVILPNAADYMQTLAESFEPLVQALSSRGYSVTDSQQGFATQLPPLPTPCSRVEDQALLERLALVFEEQSPALLSVVLELDANRDANLDRNEWHRVFSSLQAGFSKLEVDHLFRQLARPKTDVPSAMHQTFQTVHSSMDYGASEGLIVPFAGLREQLHAALMRVKTSSVALKKVLNGQSKDAVNVLPSPSVRLSVLKRFGPMATQLRKQLGSDDFSRALTDGVEAVRSRGAVDASFLCARLRRFTGPSTVLEEADLAAFVSVMDKDIAGSVELADASQTLALAALLSDVAAGKVDPKNARTIRQAEQQATLGAGFFSSIPGKVLPGNDIAHQYSFSKHERIANLFRLATTLKTANKPLEDVLAVPVGQQDANMEDCFSKIMQFIYPSGLDLSVAVPYKAGNAPLLPLEVKSCLRDTGIEAGTSKHVVSIPEFKRKILDSFTEIELLRRSALRILKQADEKVKERYEREVAAVRNRMGGAGMPMDTLQKEAAAQVDFAPTLESWFEYCEARDREAASTGLMMGNRNLQTGQTGFNGTLRKDKTNLTYRCDKEKLGRWIREVAPSFFVQDDLEMLWALGAKDANITVDYSDTFSKIRSSVKGTPLSAKLMQDPHLLKLVGKFIKWVVDVSDKNLDRFMAMFDEDANGVLDKHEIRSKLRSTTPPPLTAAEFDAVFSYLDIDGDGSMTKPEFRRCLDEAITAVKSTQEQQTLGSQLRVDRLKEDSRLKDVSLKFVERILAIGGPQGFNGFFSAVDVNNDGALSFSEIRAALASPTGVAASKGVAPMSDVEVNVMFEFIDADKSGEVSKPELVAVLEQLKLALDAIKASERGAAKVEMTNEQLINAAEVLMLWLVKHPAGGLREFFKLADKDQSNTLGYTELFNAFKAPARAANGEVYPPLALDDATLRLLIKYLDKDKDGDILVNEFIDNLRVAHEAVVAQRNAKNGSSAVPLSAAAMPGGEKLDVLIQDGIFPKLARKWTNNAETLAEKMDNLKKVFRIADTSYDGRLSRRELKQLIERTAQQEVPSSSMPAIERIVSYLDVNQDGSITTDEFQRQFIKAMDDMAQRKGIEAAHKSAINAGPSVQDAARAGMSSDEAHFADFCDWLTEYVRREREGGYQYTVNDFFSKIDTDNSQKLSLLELHNFIRTLPERMKTYQVTQSNGVPKTLVPPEVEALRGLFRHLDKDNSGDISLPELVAAIKKYQSKLVGATAYASTAGVPAAQDDVDLPALTEEQREALMVFFKWMRWKAARDYNNDLEKFFDAADRNKDGEVSMTELFDYIAMQPRSVMVASSVSQREGKEPARPSRAIIRLVFDAIDHDKSKTINFTEFKRRAVSLLRSQKVEESAAKSKATVEEKDQATMTFTKWLAKTISLHGGSIASFVRKADASMDGTLSVYELIDYVEKFTTLELASGESVPAPSRTVLRLAFQNMDLDSTQNLTVDEMTKAVEKAALRFKAESIATSIAPTLAPPAESGALPFDQNVKGDADLAKEKTLRFIAWFAKTSLVQPPVPAGTAPLTHYFNVADIDGSGSLDLKEFGKHLKKQIRVAQASGLAGLPAQPSDEEIVLAFEAMDTDKSKTLTITEVISAILKLSQEKQQEAAQQAAASSTGTVKFTTVNNVAYNVPPQELAPGVTPGAVVLDFTNLKGISRALYEVLKSQDKTMKDFLRPLDSFNKGTMSAQALNGAIDVTFAGFLNGVPNQALASLLPLELQSRFMNMQQQSGPSDVLYTQMRSEIACYAANMFVDNAPRVVYPGMSLPAHNEEIGVNDFMNKYFVECFKGLVQAQNKSYARGSNNNAYNSAPSAVPPSATPSSVRFGAPTTQSYNPNNPTGTAWAAPSNYGTNYGTNYGGATQGGFGASQTLGGSQNLMQSNPLGYSQPLGNTGQILQSGLRSDVTPPTAGGAYGFNGGSAGGLGFRQQPLAQPPRQNSFGYGNNYGNNGGFNF